MCDEFHYDRLRNDRALWNRKSDNNNFNNKHKNKNNVRGHWGPVSGSKNLIATYFFDDSVYIKDIFVFRLSCGIYSDSLVSGAGYKSPY